MGANSVSDAMFSFDELDAFAWLQPIVAICPDGIEFALHYLDLWSGCAKKKKLIRLLGFRLPMQMYAVMSLILSVLNSHVGFQEADEAWWSELTEKSLATYRGNMDKFNAIFNDNIWSCAQQHQMASLPICTRRSREIVSIESDGISVICGLIFQVIRSRNTRGK